MFVGYAANSVWTEFLKNWTGSKRPNFFSFCDYKGYREALATNDFTEYNSLTTPNAIGDIKYCRANDTNTMLLVMTSHPSGHTSYTFYGYSLLAFMCVLTIHGVTKGYNTVKAVVVLVLLFVALLLSYAQMRDYWHRPQDISTGAAIGMVVAVGTFVIYYPIRLVEENQLDQTDDSDSVVTDDGEDNRKEIQSA